MNTRREPGIVYLVGAGPGDPELLTLKAARLLALADVVLYDYLVDERVLGHVNPAAELHYVGKKSGVHTLPQEKINALLVAEAKAGKTVVRLKGGDPFVFGRGSEEALELVKHGLRFEVVPGISSAIAVPAYAGIPVTHREITSSLMIITGHESTRKHQTDLDWYKISLGKETLVFLMGVKNLAFIVEQLIAHGKDPGTLVAVIEWGTFPRQRTVVGTLTTIVELTAAARFSPPSVIVIGPIVALREQLRWFDREQDHGST